MVTFANRKYQMKQSIYFEINFYSIVLVFSFIFITSSYLKAQKQ